MGRTRGRGRSRLGRCSALDVGFGHLGAAAVPFDHVVGVAGDPWGRIMVAWVAKEGPTQGRTISVGRLTRDGAPDTSLGPDGRHAVPLRSASPLMDDCVSVSSMAVDACGRILVAGTVGELTANVPGHTCVRRAVVVRLDSDGRLDAGFGDGGVVVLRDEIAMWRARGIVVDGHGRIVGRCPLVPSRQACTSSTVRQNLSRTCLGRGRG